MHTTMPSDTPTTPAFPSAMTGASPRSMSLGSAAHLAGPPSGGSRPETPSSAGMGLLPAAMRGSMGGLTFDDVLRWSETDICAWLQSMRLGTHSSTFARNDISGAVIFDLDNGALKEMGVATVGDRIRITSAIKRLKRQCLDTEAIAQVTSDSLHQQALAASSNPSTAIPLPGHGHQHSQSLTVAPSSYMATLHQRHASASQSDQIEWVDGDAGRRGSNVFGATSSTYPSRTSPLPPHTYSNNGSDLGSGSPTAANSGRQTLREIRGLGNNTWIVQRARDGLSPVPARTMGSQQLSHQQRGSIDSRPSTVATGFPSASATEISPTMNAVHIRPSTTDGNRAALPIQTQILPASASPLTPIAEGSAFGRHPYASGTYRSGTSDASRVTSPQQQPPSIDDVKKKTIKFIGEDGTTKILAVSDCRDAYDVLARVLRKFNKPALSNVYRPTAGQKLPSDDGHDPADLDEMWGIFAMSGEGHIKFLTDNELLAICHAPQPHDPLRERGLILRRIYKGDDSMKRPTAKRSKLESFFGVASDKMGAGPFHGNGDDAGHVTTEGKRMNRASTMSILSGLGVGSSRDRENAAAFIAGQFRDGGVLSPSSIAPKKTRNFRGQRPPSELISSHLTDYFPTAEKRVLERTARRSIYGKSSSSLRSKRESTWSFAADPDAPPLPSKESFEGHPPAILIGMDRNEPNDAAAWAHQQAPILPPQSRTSFEGWSRSVAPQTNAPSGVRGSTRPTSFRRTSGESARSRQSLATKLRMARGISGADELRSKTSSNLSRGDRSETASMLTVDEITQEVESRRESASLSSSNNGWVVDEDGIPIPLPVSDHAKTSSSVTGSTRPSSQLSSADVAEPDELDEDESGELHPDRGAPTDAPGEETERHFGDPMAVARISDEDISRDSLEEDDVFDEDDLSDEEEEEGQGVYKSAAPGREPFKWIKGALIGAGSFGNVFLGMNARNGLLMAVKQVELPSGDSHSDKRKKGMLEALEREIELLKTLQHDNIVQYLDSYADGTHLNIFLEYVPGGSVAALLRNYGAFQESLVRNFVKQILHGLNFLHSREIVHRDIKGANILVDNKSCIKISDFGISKKVESDLYVTSRAHRPSLQGSVFWMAPEVVKQTSYTRKADIWSLGCLVVEMISGTHPWANLNQMQALYQIGSHAKPSLPDEISPEAVDFLNKTFELDHNKRPSADELLQHPFITTDVNLAPASVTGGESTTTGMSSSSAFDETGSIAASSATSAAGNALPYGTGSISGNGGARDTPTRIRAKAGGNARKAASREPASAIANGDASSALAGSPGAGFTGID